MVDGAELEVGGLGASQVGDRRHALILRVIGAPEALGNPAAAGDRDGRGGRARGRERPGPLDGRHHLARCLHGASSASASEATCTRRPAPTLSARPPHQARSRRPHPHRRPRPHPHAPPLPARRRGPARASRCAPLPPVATAPPVPVEVPPLPPVAGAPPAPVLPPVAEAPPTLVPPPPVAPPESRHPHPVPPRNMSPAPASAPEPKARGSRAWHAPTGARPDIVHSFFCGRRPAVAVNRRRLRRYWMFADFTSQALSLQ